MTWLFDENINKQAVELFQKFHVKIKHLAYDFPKSGIEDRAVLQFATKIKKTLITGDYSDFKRFPSSLISKSYGVWMFQTKDYKKQFSLFKRAHQLPNLKNLKDRKGKRVIVHESYVEIEDCKTGKTQTVTFSSKKI